MPRVFWVGPSLGPTKGSRSLRFTEYSVLWLLCYRQLQLQQIMQALQQQEGFSKLTTQQQQQHALQLMLKQQAGLLQQQLRQPVATIPTAMVPGMALPQQTPVELAALQQQVRIYPAETIL